MQIRTARLLLRRARPDDVDAIYAIMSDPRAMRYWSSLPHENRDVTARFIADMLVEAPDRDLFMVEQDGQVIGRLGVWKFPEVGFIFHPRTWGQGIGYEAMSAFTAHCFARPEVGELTADVDPRNAASIGLLTKLGFVETGRAERTFLIGDEWCDSIYMALPRPTA